MAFVEVFEHFNSISLKVLGFTFFTIPYLAEVFSLFFTMSQLWILVYVLIIQLVSRVQTRFVMRKSAETFFRLIFIVRHSN